MKDVTNVTYFVMEESFDGAQDDIGVDAHEVVLAFVEVPWG